MFKNIRKREDHPAIIKLGDRVLVKGTHTGLDKYTTDIQWHFFLKIFRNVTFLGVVKFVGTLDDHLVSPQCYVGVQLDEHGKIQSRTHDVTQTRKATK